MKLRDVCFPDFENEIGNKKIICIGAGELFQSVISNSPISYKVDYVADNNKANTTISIASKCYNVITLDYIRKLSLNDYVILVTTLYCKSIVEQISELLSDIDISCYIYSLMSRRVSPYKIIKGNDKPVIPKIIHYFWFGDNEIPEGLQRYISTWEKFCPDYKIIKWTEHNYDVTKCKYMKEAYDNKKWGFVPDYARLDVLYEYGGIYLDTDVELLKSFDDLLYEDAFIGFQRDFYIAAGLGFGCRKGNEIIGEMRDFYNDISFLKGDGSLNLIASPVYQTAVLKRHNIRLDNSYQKLANITIFPTDVLDPMGGVDGKLLLTSNTHSIHHYKASWVNNNDIDIMKERNEELNHYL